MPLFQPNDLELREGLPHSNHTARTFMLLFKNSVLLGIAGALVTLNPIRAIADVPKLKDSTHPSSLTDTMARAPLTKKDSSQQYLLSRGSIRMHREDHSSSVSSIQIQARMIFYLSRMRAYSADVSFTSPSKSSNQSVHNARFGGLGRHDIIDHRWPMLDIDPGIVTYINLTLLSCTVPMTMYMTCDGM